MCNPPPPTCDEPLASFPETHWWVFPAMLALWMAPYLPAHRTYLPLAVELGLVVALFVWRRHPLIPGLVRAAWFLPLASLLFLAAGEAGGQGLGGTALFLASLWAAGLVVDRHLLAGSRLSRLSRQSHLLRIPYLLGQGLLVHLLALHLLGLALPVVPLFWALPCAGLGALALDHLRGRRRPAGPAPAPDRLGLGRVALVLLLAVPLLLASHKFLIFYKYDCSGHDEMYTPMVHSIARHNNFPVRTDFRAGQQEFHIPPHKGRTYAPPAIKLGGDPRGALWPNHYGGQVLAAQWVTLSGLHPTVAYVLIQVLLAAVIFGWAVLCLGVVAGSLPAGVLCSALLWFKLFEDDFIDMDLHNLALLALLQALFRLTGPSSADLPGQRESFYYLAVCGAALYTCFPATFMIVYPILGVVLAWRTWRGGAA